MIEREKARVAKDYRVADDIRSELQREGIRIDDLNRTWSSADGRHGPRPSAYDDPSFRGPGGAGFGGGGHGADPDRHRDRSRSRSRGRRRRDRSESSKKSKDDDDKED